MEATVKKLILGALLAASPLMAAQHNMEMGGDLAKRVKDYLVIVNRDPGCSIAIFRPTDRG